MGSGCWIGIALAAIIVVVVIVAASNREDSGSEYGNDETGRFAECLSRGGTWIGSEGYCAY